MDVVTASQWCDGARFRFRKAPLSTPTATLRSRGSLYCVSSGAKTRVDNSNRRSQDSERKLSASKSSDTKSDRIEEGALTDKSPYGWISGVVGIAGCVALSGIYKNDIQQFLVAFSDRVEMMGTVGYFSYAGLYVALETVAVPATPLTLTAGYLFGVLPGVLVVSLSSTLAATLAFLISRYLLREKATEFFSGNKQFAAIDRAIEKDGFRFVFLLRLSPLLPFAASNYLYGLTSVRLGPYVLASWLGMLPGTWAYISAGNVGRHVVEGSGSGLPPWEIGLGLVVTVCVLLLTGNFAREALKESEQEEA